MGNALVVTSAAALFESVPLVLAAAAFACSPLRRAAWLVPYLGCGCGAGPSARSLPACVAACIFFGPVTALARVAAACCVSRLLLGRRPACETHGDCTLTALHRLVPAALGSASFWFFAPAVLGAHPSWPAAFAGGALAAFVVAPCGIGTVALAASIHATSAAACAGFLTVAGIVDLRALSHCESASDGEHDALSYALACIACTVLAAHGGGSVLSPRIAPLLWIAAAVFLVCAVRYRSSDAANLRIAPAIMLAGAILAAPPPEYHATETTLVQAFPGERIDFSGVLTRTGPAATIVRYAITCCRADAAPIVVRLENAPPLSVNGWVHARGMLVAKSDGFSLRVQLLQMQSAPADPFVYR